MKYTLRHSYDEPHRITGEYLDGDFKDFAGEWLIEETPSGETKVTFKVGIDPGAWVPGHIARTLNQQILRESAGSGSIRSFAPRRSSANCSPRFRLFAWTR